MSYNYVVNLWGSDPKYKNDDCWVACAFDSIDEASEFFINPFEDEKFAKLFERCTAVITLDGPSLHRQRLNPGFKPSKIDYEWHREIAMQAGMMGGCEAYNDAMSE